MNWTGRQKQMAIAAGAAAVGSWLLLRGRTITPGNYPFAYRDAEYLGVGQKLGGMVYVPQATREGARLLVYLHGNNDGGMVHGGMGASDTAYDLRRLVPEGTLVAAPSQTRNASGAGLWAGFDLDAFVAATEAAIGARVDRSNVILMGHSGAGCSTVGGLLAPLKEIRPRLVAVVDVCAGAGFGDAFGRLAARVPVHVYYQTGSWARDFAGFRAGLAGRAPLEEVKTPPGVNPHDAIVPIVAQRVLG